MNDNTNTPAERTTMTTDFTTLSDFDLDAVMNQIGRDAFRAKAPEDRARIAADYRAAMDEMARRAKADYARNVATAFGAV